MLNTILKFDFLTHDFTFLAIFLPVYGKVVQCGECGDWYHYYCLKINDTTIQILGDDDYICRVCTDNLLTIESEKSVMNNDLQDDEANEQNYNDNNLAPPVQTSANMNLSEESDTTPLNLPQIEIKKNLSNRDAENITKNKSKKTTKTNKMKKDEIVDKSYVLKLENQINKSAAGKHDTPPRKINSI